MKKWVQIVMWYITLIFALKLVIISAEYFSFQSDYKFLSLKQDMLHNNIWYFAFYAHLAGGIISVITGKPKDCGPIRC